LADLFQYPDAVMGVEQILAKEKFDGNYMVEGPTGEGKNTLARIVGARRCCGRVEPDAVDPCGHCEFCDAIFSGRRRGGTPYFEIKATDPAWESRLHEALDLGQGRMVTPHPGNPRQLPPIIVFDEVHHLSLDDQRKLNPIAEDHPAGLWLLTNAPGEILPDLQSRCQRIELKVPSPLQFEQGFGRLLARHRIPFDPDVPRLFYRASKGSIRQAVKSAAEFSTTSSGRWLAPDVRRHLGLPGNNPVGWY
jgi:DNA polymerase III gamma/tau subunit